MSNVISSATVSVKRSVSCSVLYSVLLRKQGVATFWSFESREVESRKIGKELHDSYYLLNSDLVFFSSLSWYQSFTHSHYLLSTVKLHWGGALAQLVECTSRVLRLYPQQWATVQVQPLALCCVSSHFLSSLWADWQCEEHLDFTLPLLPYQATPNAVKGQPDLPSSRLRLRLGTAANPLKHAVILNLHLCRRSG